MGSTFFVKISDLIEQADFDREIFDFGTMILGFLQ
jgi:hypothetical protein